MCKIKLGRKYKNRSGENVRILCIDCAATEYTVIGLVYRNGVEDVTIYTSRGKYYVNDMRSGRSDIIDGIY